jgi:hypothetical protein
MDRYPSYHGGPGRERRRRPIGRYLGIAAIILMMPIVVLAATIAATGTISVRVRETGPDGVNLWIPVPALLVDVAVFVAPLVIPREELAEAREHIEPWLPALQAMADELERCPEAELVSVHSNGEHVRIYKSWRSFHVDVNSHDADVEVKVPARLVSRTLDIFE